MNLRGRREKDAESKVNSYPSVEAVRRALKLLQHVNKMRRATISDLNRATGLAKSTIVRILETLMTEGYVTRDRIYGGYRVTPRVQDLSSGFLGSPLVVEAARPHAIELTNKIKWPVGIGTLDGDAVAVHFSTAPISPLSGVHLNRPLRLGLLTSSMGRCYLGYCSDHEREALRARAAQEPNGQIGDKDYIRDVIFRVRAEGYASCARFIEPSNAANISVPIIAADRVLAMLCVGYYANAMTDAERTERIIAPLQDARFEIEKSVVKLQAECCNSHAMTFEF
jgi:IclR family mhp operon transcriptional activator